MGSVRVLRRLKAGRRSSVSGTSSMFGGRGRRANNCGIAGCWTGRVVGVGILEVAGVPARDGRGLFFDRGREGACRKSSGMSFQFSMAEGIGVVVEGTRTGAEADFGGGGGRLSLGDGNGGPFEGGPDCLTESGFFSQLFSEDCIVTDGLVCCVVMM